MYLSAGVRSVGRHGQYRKSEHRDDGLYSRVRDRQEDGFLRTIPAFPRRSWVEFTSGPNIKARGNLRIGGYCDARYRSYVLRRRTQ